MNRKQYYTTRIPARSSRTTEAPGPPAAIPDIEEDERYYRPAHTQTSTRRYVNTEGHEVLEQGNRRLVIHRQGPPRTYHWLFLVGVGMLAMLLLFLAGSWTVSAWQAHQIDAQYGTPRTWQTDQVVGHSDSQDHPTHFIFLNLHARVVIVELPGGDISHARIYAGPSILAPGEERIPITGSFADVNGDGKLDMLVHVQDQTLVYLNDGTQFKPQP